MPDSLDRQRRRRLTDVIEAGHRLGDLNSDGEIDCPAGFGTNGLCDDLETTPGSGLPDYDGDHVADGTPRDTDGDGIDDYRDLDSDDDGLADAEEAGHDIGDHDGDGRLDCMTGVEPTACATTSMSPDSRRGDGTADGKPHDTDGDGLPDYRDLDRR